MILQYPVWLFLIIPLGLSIWLWPPPSRLQTILRTLMLGLLLLALSGLCVRMPSQAGTVVVVADRSLSMPAGSEMAEKEVIDILQTAMGSDDRLAVVSFGERAHVEHMPQAGRLTGFVADVGSGASNLAEGLETALMLVPRDSPGRLLVLSDGRWTGGDPAAVASWAAARGVAIDFRCLQRPSGRDLAIVRVDVPSQVASGQAFLITGWVEAPHAATITYQLYREDKVIASGRQAVHAGLNRLTFRDRALGSGSQAYRLSVIPEEDDPLPENNTARLLVGVQGPRPLLHVSPDGGSGLARLLQAGGLQVTERKQDACKWTLEELSRFSAVVLENIPAEKIGNEGMSTLATWVRETGTGLMLSGGRSSYGVGGYYKSPLEPILPVTMELRNEHRKLALAIVVVLDRSGSMAIPTSGGKTKMDLANLGTVQVLDLLGPMDEFGAIAVDTVPHTVAGLSSVKDKSKVRHDILRIESMGGGIYIYEGLAAGAKMLLGAKAGTRHIILFADANDSEEPGNYRDLLEKCEKAGITVSVIGLGTPSDHDADLLRDIAKRGKGRLFFTDKPEELPRLFAQDTFVVARNTFLDDPTPIQSTPGLLGLTGKSYELSVSLGGYNLCYLRPEATLGTVTLDEYHAPVVAAWQVGAGRALCYTGEADGKYAGGMASWKQVGDFFTSLARWTSGPGSKLGKDMMLTQEVKNGLQVIQLHLDPDRKADSFTSLPQVSVLRERPGSQPEVIRKRLRWSGPDSLALELPLESSDTCVAAVTVQGQNTVALPPVCLPYSPEYAPQGNERGLQTLEKLGRISGGKERPDLQGIWKELPRHIRLWPIGHWLPLAAIALFLLEVLERRTYLLSMLGRRLRDSILPALAAPRKWLLTGSPTQGLSSTTTQEVAGGTLQPHAEPARNEPSPTAPTAMPAEPRADGVMDALQAAREKSRRRLES